METPKEKRIFIRNNNVLKSLNSATGFMGYTADNVISEIEQKFQPSIETNPLVVNISNIVRNLTRTTTGSGTIYTTPTDKDFYLVSASLSFIKDATCDQATGTSAAVNVVIDGTTVSTVSTSGLTLTAQSGEVSLSSGYPIKVDRGTTITIGGGAYTVGTLCRAATIQGFTLDPNTYNLGQIEVKG